jgi:hypothetical protein
MKKNMRFNFRRGLFRVWIVLSCLWAILVCAVWFGDVRGEFAKAASVRHVDYDALAAKYGGVQESDAVAPRKAPGRQQGQYSDADVAQPKTLTDPDAWMAQHQPPPQGLAPSQVQPAPCTPNRFGDLPVSCGDLRIVKSDPLSTVAGLTDPAHPWRIVLKMIAWAAAPPIGIFILGLSCLWAIAGFARTESTS